MEEETKMYDDFNGIKCPHCEENQNYETCEGPITDLVTYHGEGDPEEQVCKSCDKKFYISEMVIRSWEVAKNEDDF